MPLSLPPDEYMVPGEVYVGKLPGDKRPSFVRKRERSNICDALGQVFSRKRYAPISNKMMSWSHRNYYRSSDDYDYYPRRRRRYARRPEGLVPDGINHGRLATSIAQVCAACGKHRSPGWSSRHPLTPGEWPKPTLCKKCRAKSTSSEEDPCTKHFKKKHKHCHHGCSSSEEEHFCSGSHHNHSYHHRHSHARPKQDPRENVNIFIENDRVVREVHPVVSEPPSSEESIRIVRKSLPRARSRSILLEDLEERLPRRRSHSSIHIVRSRSPKPVRYVDERDMWPRQRRRSTSHVSFVDEPEEIHVSRSKSTRRPRMYYDGANSGESERYQAYATSDTSRDSEEVIATPDDSTTRPHPDVQVTDSGSSEGPSLMSFKEHTLTTGSQRSSSSIDLVDQAHLLENTSPNAARQGMTVFREDEGMNDASTYSTPPHPKSRASDKRPTKRQRLHTDLYNTTNESYKSRQPKSYSAEASRNTTSTAGVGPSTWAAPKTTPNLPQTEAEKKAAQDLAWDLFNMRLNAQDGASGLSKPNDTFNSSDFTPPLTPMFNRDAYQHAAGAQPYPNNYNYGYDYGVPRYYQTPDGQGYWADDGPSWAEQDYATESKYYDPYDYNNSGYDDYADHYEELKENERKRLQDMVRRQYDQDERERLESLRLHNEDVW